MTRPTAPSADQLDHLVDTASRRRLTPDEDAALRAGVRQLRASLAGAGAAARRAPTPTYLAQLQQQAARAGRYRTAWQSARRRASQEHGIVDRHRADHIARLLHAIEAHPAAPCASSSAVPPADHDVHISEDEDGWRAFCWTCGEAEEDLGSKHDSNEWAERHLAEAQP
ncbi:hypothetical protein ACGFZP_05235 [Kitasatospora sp. NPDC048239]|uniref:hypothetical protein n=1 Tax=Kitasatospora sp. NPDC048239 TaxID=3364046 RepID=UPI00371CB30E